MKRFKKDEIVRLCKQAYKEGKEHQFKDDFPDVGMGWVFKFKDTKTYKELKNKKWI